MRYEIHPELDKILEKLSKKDRRLFTSVLNKIQEIIACKDLNHYKNLRKPLQNFKRVHVGSHVLLFTKKQDCISFRYFDHHDKIYKK